MNLKDAMEQVEREQPHLRGTAKLEAIKALRAQPAEPEPIETAPEPVKLEAEDSTRKPTSVGEAWALLALVAVGMRVIPYFVWGSLDGEPHWYDVLHAVLLIGAIIEVVSAHRRRRS